MLDNKNKFFRVELYPIGINLNLKEYNKSTCYFNNGFNIKLYCHLKKGFLKNKSNKLFISSLKNAIGLKEEVIFPPKKINYLLKIEILLHDTSKLKKIYAYKKDFAFLKFFYIEKFNKIPLNFWEINNIWDNDLINTIMTVFKNKIDRIFRNFNWFKSSWYLISYGLIELKNKFLQEKLYFFYNKYYLKTKNKIKFEESLNLSLPSKWEKKKLNLKGKKNVFKHLQFYEKLNYKEYKLLYLNKLFRNLLFQKGYLYPIFFTIQKKEYPELLENLKLYIKKEKYFFKNLLKFEKKNLFFINKFFLLILILYRKNYLNLINELDLIKVWILHLKFIVMQVIKIK